MNNISSLLNDIIQAPEATNNVCFGIVTEVDSVERTCSVRPYNSTAVIEGVRLIAQSDVSDGDIRQGVELVPKISSVVMVVMESDTEGFIGLFSQVETVSYKIKSNEEDEGSIVFKATGSKQEVKSKTGMTNVDISADGYSQTTGTTTVGITENGYAQKTSSSEVNFKDDGFLIKRNSKDLESILKSLVTAIKSITVPTGVGPSGMPINAIDFTNIETDIETLFN